MTGKASEVKRRRRLVVGLWFFATSLLALRTVASYDVYWHLKVGKDIWRTLSLPVFEQYSMHEGLRFVSHEWLFDALLAGAYSLFGPQGILLLMQTATLMLSVLLYRILSRRVGQSGFAVLYTLVLTGLLVSRVIVPRPQMLSFVLLLWLIAVLEGPGLDGSHSAARSMLMHIGLIALLWGNLHGGSYPLMLIVIGGYFIQASLERDWHEPLRAWRPGRRLIVAGLLVLLGVSINPHGPYLLLFPFSLISEGTTAAIHEWQNLPFDGLTGLAHYLLFLIPLLVWCASKSLPSLRDALFTLLFSYMALASRRHLSLAVLFLYLPLAAPYKRMAEQPLGRIRERIRSRSQSKGVWLAVAMVLLFATTLGLYNRTVPLEAEMVPAEALAYMQEQGIAKEKDARLFNDYNWGGYLLYHDVTVFIDGRADVYQSIYNASSTVMQDYLDIVNIRGTRELIDGYGFEYMLIRADSSLAYFMSREAGWEMLLRTEEENALLLGKTEEK